MSHEPSLHTSVASSVITVQRSADHTADAYHIHSASAHDATLLAARALKAGAVPRPNDRFDDTLGVKDGQVDRWSQQSIGRKMNALDDNTWRMTGTSPGASPRPGFRDSPGGSPGRFRRPQPGDRLSEYTAGRVNRRPGSSRSKGATPTLGSGGLPPADPSMLAPGRSPLVTPGQRPTSAMGSAQNTPNAVAEGDDYFGLGIAVTKDNQAPGKTTEAASSNPAIHYTTRRANFAPLESPTSDVRAKIRTTKEKRERDKKSMLSKALEKANTAVMLDNAQNFAAALDAYHDACLLLAQVMERTSGADDRAKLDAIRVTYSNRMEELTIMQTLDVEESDEKELPPRPDSEESDDVVPHLEVEGIGEAEDIAAPGATRAGRTRDSFLTDVIREVEGSSSTGFLGPLWERSKTPLGALSENDRPDTVLNGPDAPAPLRTPSPQPPQKTDDAGEPVSWLNTIDESDSDSASVHSGKGGDVRRRNLNKGKQTGPSALDTAFDEAVEAVYADGYQLDHGDQAQHMLDDIAKDFLNQDIYFNPKSLSSLPQDSFSTIGTQTSAQSNATAATSTTDASVDAPKPLEHPTMPGTHSNGMSEDAGRRPSVMSAKAPSVAPSIESHSARRRMAPTIANKNLDVTPWEAADSSEVTPWETSTASDVTPWETQAAPASTSSALKDRRNRLSNSSVKPLTIETPAYASTLKKRAPSVVSKQTTGSQRDLEVTPWDTGDSRTDVTPWETQTSTTSDVTPWESQSAPSGTVHIQKVVSRKQDAPQSAISDSGSSGPGDMTSPKTRLLRSQKSITSLRDQSVLEDEPPMPTPQTSTSFASTRPRHDSTSQHSNKSFTLTSTGTMPPLPVDGGHQGGMYLFDTTLGRSIEQVVTTSPRTPKELAAPAPFEPCPDSNLLRPFWLLRSVANTIIHPRGGYITTRLFMLREVWLNRSAKLKNVEDKILACDTLTAALHPLETIDHNDADAVLEELQKFEEAMERVQTMLSKKLGSDVGVSNSMFKDADKAAADTITDASSRADSKFSWKKLRGKPAASGSTGVTATNNRGSGENASMATVPMTSFTGIERKTAERKQALADANIEGPLKSYMEAIARLGVAAQVIDEIARQVEDPGLKHSSATHVGLEMSTRHAAEFFGFYICRFLLADVGTLLDKFVKRSTEWVLA